MYQAIDIDELLSGLHERTLFFEIIQVGAGGNGGYIVPRLAKTLRSFQDASIKMDFTYTLVDGDVVEKKNLRRQPFIDPDIDQKKVHILANRYGGTYNIPIYEYNQYIEHTEQLKSLFQLYHESIETYNEVSGYHIPILVGCVDNNATRKIMHEVFLQMETIIYLDCGIDGILLNGTEQKKAKSGYSGHVVCGFKHRGDVILEDVVGVYPTILEDEDSLLPTQTCAQAAVNNPQRMQTNEMAALLTCGYLNNLIGNREIVTHYTNFNARNNVIRSKFIEKDEKHDQP